MVAFELIKYVKHGLLKHEEIEASRFNLFILFLLFKFGLFKGFGP